jgi:hypothetical protein
MAGGLYLPAVSNTPGAASGTDITAPGVWASLWAQSGQNNVQSVGMASADALNSVATPSSAQQLQVSARWAVARILYGTDRLGAGVYNVGLLGGRMIFWLVWGYGPWDGLVDFTMGDLPLPSGVVATHYDGSQTTYDPTLAALYNANDAQRAAMVYPNLVYTVVSMLPSDSAGLPQFAAVWRGRKVFDPRENRLTYSNTLSNAAWSSWLGALVQGATAPDGTPTAWTLTDNTASSYQGISRSMAIAADGASYTVSFSLAKTSGGTSPTFAINLALMGGTAVSGFLRLDTDTGTALWYTGWTIISENAGFWRCTRTLTNNGTNTLLSVGIYPATAAHGSSADTVTATGSAVVANFQLNFGASGLPYTPTTAAAVVPVTAWSDNPALATADYRHSTVYGMGRSINWASVIPCANYNDQAMANGERRRTINLTLDQKKYVDEWSEALRTYAGCWIIDNGNESIFIADAPASPVMDFDHDAGDIETLAPLTFAPPEQVPTIVQVVGTDTSAVPWKEQVATAAVDGVEAGAVPRRLSRVSLPGYHSLSQLQREANDRLNKAQANITTTLTAFDRAAVVQAGDVIRVKYDAAGLAYKEFRSLSPSGANGSYKLALREYRSACYSDEVVAPTSTPGVGVPKPSAPPAGTGLALAEEVYEMQTGLVASRIAAVWDAANFVFATGYRVECLAAGVVLQSATVTDPNWRSGPVQENVAYTVRVAILTAYGMGDFTAGAITAQGTNLLPGNVASIKAFEAGGSVYMAWPRLLEIGVVKYWLRYWPVGGNWETGTDIDIIPVGVWVIGIKAVDSVIKPGQTMGQTSVVATTTNVTVTSDAASFLVDSYDQTAPTLTNMTAFHLAPWDTHTYYVTDDGVPFDTKFPNPIDSYTNPLDTYHNAVASTWLGEGEDFGELLGGQWTGTADVADLSGSHVSSIGFSTNGSSYSYLAGLSQKQNARFARLKHEATGAATMLVTAPSQKIRIDAVPRTEVVWGTTSATGPVTVTLTNAYVACKRLVVTALGAGAGYCKADAISPGSPTTFQVNGMDGSSRVAIPFMAEWEGV